MATFDDLTANSRWIVVSLRRPSSSSTTIKVSHASLHAHCLNVSFSHHIDLTALCRAASDGTPMPLCLMRVCWQQDPYLRPSFEEINSVFRALREKYL